MSDLNESSILLLMRFSKPGNRRKVSSGMVEVDADKTAISVGKELLDSKELTDINSFDGMVRRWVYARSLPSGVLKEGVYRLPLTLVDEVDNNLKVFSGQRGDLVNVFLDVYPIKVEEARSRLRILYDASDYPPVDEVGAAFDFQWRYLALGIPENISSVLIKEQRQKAAQDLETEMDEIRLALRTAFADLVSHAAAALTTGPDNKPKIFRDSLVKNLDQFFQYFEARNLTQDKDLENLVEQARSIMEGVSPEDLRTDLNLRQTVQQTMTQVKDAINANVMLKPSRRFSLSPVAAPVS